MNIFLVQNNHAELETLRICVEICYPGSTISCFAEGEAAMEAVKLSDADIDICFTSLEMLSGIELAKCLRQKSTKTKLVFVENSDRYAMDAWQLSASDYIIKPVTIENVQHTVESCTA